MKSISKINSCKDTYIRSFVRRQSRITPVQRRALDTLWPLYGVELTDTPLNFTTLFDKDAFCVLEIGFGRGDALLSMVKNYPSHHFIGIEIHQPGIGHLLNEIHKADIKNLRIIENDAVLVLKQHISDQTLDRIQIYFPDPWPKRRHHKRRLINQEFIALLHKKLKPNGVLHIATDWEDYAKEILALLNDFKGFENNANHGGFAKKPDYRPTTKFENRGKQLGHKVFDLLFSAK